MKTFRNFIIGFALIPVFGAAKANGLSKTDIAALNSAINIYVNAVTHNKVKGLAEVIDPSAKFNILSQRGILSINKGDMIDFVKSNENLEYNCQVKTTTIQSNDDVVVVRIDMQFPTFVCSNYVTIANTYNGWKITNGYSVFK